jgi:hypothetical protein
MIFLKILVEKLQMADDSQTVGNDRRLLDIHGRERPEKQGGEAFCSDSPMVFERFAAP